MTFLSIAIGLCIGAIIFDKYYNYSFQIMGVLIAIGLIITIVHPYINKGDGKYEIKQGDSTYYTDEYTIDEQQNIIRFHSNCCDRDIILYGTFTIEEKKDN